MFAMPLILAAAFFAFAHGANDTANIAAPLATIANIAVQGTSPSQVTLPIWALAIGAFGIGVGLITYGNRLVRTVGSEITEIDKLRAFCIAISAASVILVASHFGFPVSTTHTLVGSIFGVGLLREWSKLNEHRTLEKIRKCYAGEEADALERFLTQFQGATLARKRSMLDALFREHGAVQLSRKDLKRVRNVYHRQMVKRTLFRRIIAFWVLTIPATGLLGAFLVQVIESAALL